MVFGIDFGKMAREAVYRRMDRQVAALKLKDGIDVVIAVGASDKRKAELAAQQEQLNKDRSRLGEHNGNGELFARRQQILDERRRKLETDEALVQKYCQLRWDIKHQKDLTYPKVPTLAGDEEASFMLAIKNGIVIGGIRLNEVPAGHVPPLTGAIEEKDRLTPIDKIIAARLENIFNHRHGVTFNRADYHILNIDGAFVADKLDGKDVERPFKTAVLQKLFESLVSYVAPPGPHDLMDSPRRAREAALAGYNPKHRYDMAYFVPAEALAEPIAYFFKENPQLFNDKGAMFVQLGNGQYTDRGSETKERPIFGIILNDKLKGLIPQDANILADHTPLARRRENF